MNPYNIKGKITLFVLILIILASTLINSQLFIYQTLTSYFLFTTISGIIILYACLQLLKGNYALYFSFPSILFLIWGCYIVLHGVIIANWNFRYSYLVLGILFYFSLTILFSRSSTYKAIYLIISVVAVLEAFLCVFQYLGFVHSLNNYFKVTGTIVNPNVTAMFLSMALCPSIYSIMENKEKSYYKWINIIVTVIIVIALLLLKCRTAIIGAVVAALIVLNARYKIHTRLAAKRNNRIIFILLFLILGLCVPFLSAIYSYKLASAEGRKTVWKITIQTIADKPWLGYGYGLFERNYNLHQSSYFKQGNNSAKEVTNASFVHMAYNEPLENAVEGGISGSLLFAGVIISLLICSPTVTNHVKDKATTAKEKNKKSSINQEAIIIPAYAGISSFAFMSLVNFTIQAIPVFCLLSIYAAMLSANCANPKIISNWNSSTHTKFQKSVSIAAIIFVLFLVSGQVKSMKDHLSFKNVIEQEKDHKGEVVKELKELENGLSLSESYQKYYGRALMSCKNYGEALTHLNLATCYTSEPDVYMDIGWCCENLNKPIEAELNFELAMFMVPNRFKPKYLLMEHYRKEEDSVKMVQMAHSIVEMKPKVPSRQVSFYKQEALKILHESNIKEFNADLNN